MACDECICVPPYTPLHKTNMPLVKLSTEVFAAIRLGSGRLTRDSGTIRYDRRTPHQYIGVIVHRLALSHKCIFYHMSDTRDQGEYL